MIVTRRHKKPFPWRRLLFPAVVLALVAAAILWGPARNAISNGPLAPLWRAGENLAVAVAAPFHFAAQNQVIADRSRQILQLQTQLKDAQTQAAAASKQVAGLQQQLNDLQAQAATQRSQGAVTTPASSAPGGATTVPGSPAQTGGFVAGDLASGSSADMRRTAQYWASMDPDNAAKVVQRLPVSYVARVFATMSPSDVGAILDALPATYAAELTQENPELRR